MNARSKLALAACLIALSVPPAAQANDAVVGALFGAGAGALLGQAFGGRDGAVAGGVIGALAGAASASNDEPAVGVAAYPAPAYVPVHRPVAVSPAPYGGYGAYGAYAPPVAVPYGYAAYPRVAAPVVVYQQPPVVVVSGGRHRHHGHHGHYHGHGNWYR